MTGVGFSGVAVRDCSEEDLDAVGRILKRSPEAAQWKPKAGAYGGCRVAERGGEVVGFIVVRPTAPGEYELLNLAVDPAHRRRGVAARLLADMLSHLDGEVFLEVRESNSAAIELYKWHGFCLAGIRQYYYKNPRERAIVMRFQSC